MRNHKITAIIVSLMFIFSFMTPAAYASKITDVQGHWAETAIKEMVNEGIISGYPDGSFKPDGKITRAEFASLIVKGFRLKANVNKEFSDTKNHWAKDFISIAYANNILSGYSDDRFGADDSITREQMALMIVKATGLTDANKGKVFTDNNSIADWAREAVAIASGNNLINGYPDKSFNPQGNASRAEAALVLSKSLKVQVTPEIEKPSKPEKPDYSLIDEAGIYGPKTDSETVTGDVTIKARDTTLRNLLIKGDLIIAKEVGNGDVTLDNIIVQGKTYIRGGGINSIYINGGEYKEVIVEATATGAVRIVAVDVKGLQVTIAENAKGEEIILKGDFKNITIKADDVKVTTQADTKIDEVKVPSGLKDVNIELNKGSSVKEMVLDSKADVKGQGATDKASGKEASNSNFQTAPGTISLSTSGGGGGGGSSSSGGGKTVAVSDISVTGAGGVTTITDNGGTLQMVATITPNNASNKTVTWTVTETDDSATDKATISNTGLLTAVKDGIVKVTATAKDGSGKSGFANIEISNQVTPPETFKVTLAGDAVKDTDYTISGASDLDAVVDGTELTITATNAIVVNSENVAAAGEKKITITAATTITINKQVTRSATVSDVTVSGVVGAMTSDYFLTITLVNDNFKEAINAGVQVADWFKNLPANSSNYISPNVSVPAGGTEIKILIRLTATAASSEVMEITIPGGSLTSGESLTVTSNSNAKFDITEPPTPIEFTSLTANGTSKTETTTELTITFNEAITSLTADDFEVTGATKGSLSGSGSSYTLGISDITVADGAEVTVAVSKIGYTFSPASKGVAVYVATTYAVTYDGNDSTGGLVPTDNSKYEKDAEVTVLGEGSLVKESYTFNGWNTKADGTGTSYVIGGKFNITEDITLYAQWKKNAYTLTLSGDGLTSDPAAVDIEFGTSVTITVTPSSGQQVATFKVDGNDKKDQLTGSPLTYTFTMPTKAVTVEVTYENIPETYTVTYDGNESTEGAAPVDSGSPYEENSQVTVLNKGDLVRKGYDFDGWNTASDGTGEAYVAGGTFKITNNTTLYAQWTPANLAGTATIEGDLKYGKELTANITGITNNTGVLSYQWKRGTEEISGATSYTYTVVEDDINTTLSVVVISSVQKGNITETASSAISKADGPSAPAVVGSVSDADNEILVVGGEEKITVTIGSGMTDNYEYSLDGGSTWAELLSGDITGLTSAVTQIQIRVKATTTHEAGAVAEEVVSVTENKKTVTIGDLEGGSIVAGQAASDLKYEVTTTMIANNEEVTIKWYKTEEGTETDDNPTGITITGSNVSSNNSTLTVTVAKDETLDGNYYFTVTIDGIESDVKTLVVFKAKKLEINSKEITLASGENVTEESSGTLSWDYATNTLTMDNYKGKSIIYLQADKFPININVIGENELISDNYKENLSIGEALSITGESDATLTLKTNGHRSIYAQGNISISGDLKINIEVDDKTTANGTRAIHTSYSVIVKDNADIYIKALGLSGGDKTTYGVASTLKLEDNARVEILVDGRDSTGAVNAVNGTVSPTESHNRIGDKDENYVMYMVGDMEIEYVNSGTVGDISNVNVTFNDNKFTIKATDKVFLDNFTFNDGDKEMEATFANGEWSFEETL